ncbi:T-lymphocyte surface antigen Ly-9-like [Channa argus]|uniref:T-lymphocyte surface antigen Ly-9-like n=1 Tax=Channa argus TaxID=215402 RepID=UPI003522DCF8
MERLTGSWFMAALFLMLFSSARAQNVAVYFAVGGSLEMMPPEATTGDLTSILWKYKGNVVAKWVKDKVPLEFYSKFRGRTKLDTGNGLLVITKMTEGDTGLYTVEINNKVQGVSYNATLAKKVPKPKVLIRPLVCGSTGKRWTLTCAVSTTGAGPVTYSWKKGDRDWDKSGRDVDIINEDEMQSVKTFSCQMKNPVSKEESFPVKNPLFQENNSDPGSGFILEMIVGKQTGWRGEADHGLLDLMGGNSEC